MTTTSQNPPVLDTEKLVQKFRDYNWAAEALVEYAEPEQAKEFRQAQESLAHELTAVAARLEASEEYLAPAGPAAADARNSLNRSAWALGQFYLTLLKA